MKKAVFHSIGLSFFLLFISITFLSFQDTLALSPRQLIQKEIDKKIHLYKTNYQKKCKKDALLKAEALVDSMLLARAKAERQDSITRPIIPPKPVTPSLLTPKDSSDIAPIIKDSFIRAENLPVNDSLKE